MKIAILTLNKKRIETVTRDQGRFQNEEGSKFPELKKIV